MSQFRNRRRPFLRCNALLLGAIVGFAGIEARAEHLDRIWVDAGGTFSVQAALVDWTDDTVVLMRADGGEVTLSLDQLSESDKIYLQETRDAEENLNSLRGAAPSPPVIAPLATLKLPPATHIADSGAILCSDGKLVSIGRDELPRTLAADRSPWDLAMMDGRISLPVVDFNMKVSEPIAITILSESGTRATALAASISNSIRLPGEKTRQELVRFDVADSTSHVAMRHYETIHMLDHHLDSGQSLVLVGFNSLGRGGDLAVVTGWQNEAMGFSHRRSLDGKKSPGEQSEVRFAKWVDDEHVLAIINHTLGLWNIVSGEQLYRIEGVDPRAKPAISGGGRYLALPFEGGVDVISTATGKSLGRIKVEKQVPGVQFSPLGNQLAIATTRRLRVWDLTDAALAADVRSRNSLGKGGPLWIDHDLLLTDSGMLVSLFRGVPIWRYDVAGTLRSSVGKRVAVLRKSPVTELDLVTIPHEGAAEIIRRIDSSPVAIDPEKWQVLGRSIWQNGEWVDRDVQIGSLPINRR